MNPHLECEIIDKIFRDEKLFLLLKDIWVLPKINSTQIFGYSRFDENGKPVDTPNRNLDIIMMLMGLSS